MEAIIINNLLYLQSFGIRRVTSVSGHIHNHSHISGPYTTWLLGLNVDFSYWTVLGWEHGSHFCHGPAVAYNLLLL